MRGAPVAAPAFAMAPGSQRRAARAAAHTPALSCSQEPLLDSKDIRGYLQAMHAATAPRSPQWWMMEGHPRSNGPGDDHGEQGTRVLCNQVHEYTERSDNKRGWWGKASSTGGHNTNPVLAPGTGHMWHPGPLLAIILAVGGASAQRPDKCSPGERGGSAARRAAWRQRAGGRPLQRAAPAGGRCCLRAARTRPGRNCYCPRLPPALFQALPRSC
jgi:hypothetical protein